MYLVGECRLKTLLENRKMSQTELAISINVTPQQINKYAMNKRIMSLQVAKNISNVLNCELEDLYEWISVDIKE